MIAESPEQHIRADSTDAVRRKFKKTLNYNLKQASRAFEDTQRNHERTPARKFDASRGAINTRARRSQGGG